MQPNNKRLLSFLKSKVAFVFYTILLCILVLVVAYMASPGVRGGWESVTNWIWRSEPGMKLLFVCFIIACTLWRLGYLCPYRGKIRDKDVNIASQMFFVLFVLGAVTLSVGLIGAAIGIFRGYSLQSSWGEITMGIGLLSLTAAFAILQKKRQLFVVVVTTILLTIIWGLQGKYYDKGQLYYSSKRYEQAAKNFREEINTWYLRFVHNPYESEAAEALAKTYQKLGQNDKARQTYEMIIKRYPSPFVRRAKWKLREMDARINDPNATSPE